MRNEVNCHTGDSFDAVRECEGRLDTVAAAMRACVAAGTIAAGILPGGLKVPRRAAAIADRLARDQSGRDLTTEWLHVFAIAVNEENAAGNRIVTAPTNGAAGIIPAVLTYYERFIGATARDIRVFLLTAGGDRLGDQRQRVDLWRGGRMPGRSRLGVRDGRRRSVAVMGGTPGRSRTPPRSRWSTTSASPATRSGDWCRSRASNATPSRRPPP